MVLVALMGAAFVASVAEGLAEGMRGTGRHVLFWSQVLVYTALILGWVHLDAAERSNARPRWLTIGVIAIAIVFVPVYLLRSRPKGARARALGGFFLAGLGFCLAAFAGGFLGELIRG